MSLRIAVIFFCIKSSVNSSCVKVEQIDFKWKFCINCFSLKIFFDDSCFLFFFCAKKLKMCSKIYIEKEQITFRISRLSSKWKYVSFWHKKVAKRQKKICVIKNDLILFVFECPYSSEHLLLVFPCFYPKSQKYLENA